MHRETRIYIRLFWAVACALSWYEAILFKTRIYVMTELYKEQLPKPGYTYFEIPKGPAPRCKAANGTGPRGIMSLSEQWGWLG